MTANDKTPNKRFCCVVTCEKGAEFEIHSARPDPEDNTEACTEHVGTLLGTPTWREAENTEWIVVLIPQGETATKGRE